MDGVSKAQQQVKNGTRPIIDLLNELRIYYGYDAVQVKTPIVESRLRAGLIPAKPLVVAYSTDAVDISLTVPCGYPQTSPMQVDLVAIPPFQPGEGELLALRERCQAIAEQANASAKDMFAQMLQEIGALTQQLDYHRDDASPAWTGGADLAPIVADIDDTTGDIPVFYHCRKCRALLFDSLSFNDHSVLPSTNSNACTSFFLEEPPGYVVVDGLDAGKINCPKCSTRVGAWSWLGTTCSCNVWVAPAFQFTKSKVESKP